MRDPRIGGKALFFANVSHCAYQRTNPGPVWHKDSDLESSLIGVRGSSGAKPAVQHFRSNVQQRVDMKIRRFRLIELMQVSVT